MRILILDEDKVTKLFLPSIVSGAYIFSPGDEKKYLNIEAENDGWVAKSNGSINIIDSGSIINKVSLKEFDYYHLNVSSTSSDYLMFCMPTMDTTFKKYTIIEDRITIGKGAEDSISINVEFLKTGAVIIEKVDDQWKLTVADDNLYIYVNDKRTKTTPLKVGDSIFIYGVMIVWLGSFIQINNPVGIVDIRSGFSIFQDNTAVDNSKYDQVEDADKDISIYEKDSYFFHRPRLIQTVDEVEVKIDAPPESTLSEELPWILTMGTSITMVAFASVTVLNLLNNISNGTAKMMQVVTSLITCVAMILGSLVFPTLLRKYNKIHAHAKEKERIEKYTMYLEKKEEEINNIIEKQTQILKSSALSVQDCYSYTCNGTQNIWTKDISDNDFLEVRLGKGNVHSNIKITAPEEHFTLNEDVLKTKVYEVVNKSRLLCDVPITYNFTSSIISAIITNNELSTNFINGIILQLVALQSPNDLKIVSLLNKNDSIVYNYLKYMPHSFSSDKDMRFFAENTLEAKTILAYLKKIYDERLNSCKTTDGTMKEVDYKMFNTYYMILCDNFMNIRDSQFVNDIINANYNVGFSFIILDKSMQKLPRKCENIISMDAQAGVIIKKNLNNQTIFIPEYDTTIDMRKVGTHLMKVPVMNTDFKSYLPTSISFLEMLKVSKIEQLNVVSNWKNNNPVVNLQAPVGVHTDGETFYLDLHEKAHGPHGLIAGSTGSGKSEFIITYILSMCITYSPDEVQFILIDYKGGGLAGAFYNEKTGIKVPHIAGVLTDLDTSDMNRAIVSINSELKRREHSFNEAKVITGESTIDIYKYQKYYREGILKEPISHLFIVSDEFAELKSQQPDFISNLISISRIGRSLGVHLILATQKPSGVVNDQIWSNSKFKICLKVATRSDSMEMLKRPEAASLKETGRFYLQVGYDELFEIGQSGWSGAKYFPNDRIIKKFDDSITFIDNLATGYKSVNDIVQNHQAIEYGDQLTNVVKHLTDIAKKIEYKTKKLWLDKIPNEVFLSLLGAKYKGRHTIKPYILNPVIGEYDHPAIQSQNILELNLQCRNTLILGTNTSGLDEILKTIIFSACIEHTPEEVNFYIIDMGAESLRIFNKYPQVGDICTVEDGDKILNMLMIGENEITRRKDLFSNYSGSYVNYIESGNVPLPTIVFIINYMDVFQENFSKIADALTTIYRDGPKYGIEFVITGNVGCLRTKVMEFFQNIICLQLPDKEKYRDILESPRGLVPSSTLGRGLVKVGKEVLEFQTAFISDKNTVNTTIKSVADALCKRFQNKAPNVPVIPKIVSLNMVMDSVKSYDSLVIGYDVATKRELTYDMTSKKIIPILAEDMKSQINFIYALIEEIKAIENVKLQIIDVDSMIDFNKLHLVEFYNQDFDSVISKMYQDVTHPIQNVLNVYMITGIGKLQSKLGMDATKLYNSIFTYVDRLPNAFYLFVDNYESYKKLQVEDWYSTSIDSKCGIWLGLNVGSQIAITFNKLSLDEKRISIPDVAFATEKNKNYCFKKVVTIDEEQGD